MSTPGEDSILARLAKGNEDSFVRELEATPPKHAPQESADPKLESLLGRLEKITGKKIAKDAPAAAPEPAVGGPVPEGLDDSFLPLEPKSFREMELTDSEIEALVLKFLLARGDASGRETADQIKLPFVLIDELMRQMKFDQLLIYRGSAPMNDYVYQLTDLGRERARRYNEHCTYFGSAPVSLPQYIASVEAQSLKNLHPTQEDLDRTFRDLLINKRMFRRLGPAINSGKGMFLYGAPGNGKTSIAQRVTRAFGSHIWIPRAIGIDGEIMRLFDPMNHEEAPLESDGGLLQNVKVDARWVRIVRPTIVVGGELTMDQLEVMLNTSTGINESPIQLKSNCGTLVIDDFGRQRMNVDELLNRWIVPLEDRVDFLNLPSGKTIRVPFDQLIVFSTNLEPKDLVDEAFLRRIPYKIEVIDPSEEEFRKLFEIMCPLLGFEFDGPALDYLIEKHYRPHSRPFRACHPRDLLKQIHDHCQFVQETPSMKPEYFDAAVDNYFSVM